MDLRPWDLWTADGKPQPETPEILAHARGGAANGARPSAGAATSTSTPSRRRRIPRRRTPPPTGCATSQPGLGHLVHMPSHIDVRRGRWQEAVEANERGDRGRPRATERSCRSQGFYRIYMAHNHHMLAFAAMMHGPEQAGAATPFARCSRACRPTGREGERRHRRRLLRDAARGADALRPVGRDPGRAGAARAPSRSRGPLRHAARAASPSRPRASRPRPAREQKRVPRGRGRRSRRRRPFGNNTAADLLAVAEHAARGRDPAFARGRSTRGPRGAARRRREGGRAALRRAAGLDPAGAPRARRGAAEGRAAGRGGGGLPRGPARAGRTTAGRCSGCQSLAFSKASTRRRKRPRRVSARSGSTRTSDRVVVLLPAGGPP